MQTLTLRNGVEIPQIGFGVFQIPEADTERCVLDALEVGYRHIDTAQAYHNEKQVGEALKHSGLKREDVFVTTKVWLSNAGEKKASESIERSLELLGDRIDLLLIHQPFSDYYGTYRAMLKFYEQGLVRAVGVSNFYPGRYADIADNFDVAPMVNQIELHPFYQRENDLANVEKHGGVVESWGPFAEGRNGLFTNPVLTSIGNKYGKSAAQVTLRWMLQRGIVVLPKSVHRERMEQNFDIFDFALSDEDMRQIATLDGGKPLFMDHRTAQVADMFNGKQW